MCLHIATLYFLINLQHNNITVSPTAIIGHEDQIETSVIRLAVKLKARGQAESELCAGHANERLDNKHRTDI